MSAVTINTASGNFTLLPNKYRHTFQPETARLNGRTWDSTVAKPERKSVFTIFGDYFSTTEGLGRGLKAFALTGRTALVLDPSLSKNTFFKVGQTFTHIGRDVLGGAAAVG